MPKKEKLADGSDDSVWNDKSNFCLCKLNKVWGQLIQDVWMLSAIVFLICLNIVMIRLAIWGW